MDNERIQRAGMGWCEMESAIGRCCPYRGREASTLLGLAWDGVSGRGNVVLTWTMKESRELAWDGVEMGSVLGSCCLYKGQ